MNGGPAAHGSQPRKLFDNASCKWSCLCLWKAASGELSIIHGQRQPWHLLFFYMSFGEKHLKYRLGETAQVLGCSVGLPSGGAEQEGSVGSDSSQGPPKVLIQWLWPVWQLANLWSFWRVIKSSLYFQKLLITTAEGRQNKSERENGVKRERDYPDHALINGSVPPNTIIFLIFFLQPPHPSLIYSSVALSGIQSPPDHAVSLKDILTRGQGITHSLPD